ncbi:thioredoxin family protein [Methyloversatilis universalis]|uniref:thioredoxin family protein n=1 Tax=Methyloversatilis universalis TaxID=378211 RepID=UPI000369A83B|nr:thioredoxin family protein [Methyloversatilis universalis]
MSLAVVCLCAEWCGTCRDFRALFDGVAGQWPDAGFVWADVETHEDLLDDLDLEIENFPTVLIASGDGRTLHFAGPITPFADTLQRLCRTAAAGDLPAIQAPAWLTLLSTLRRP